MYWHIPNAVWWVLGPVVAWRLVVLVHRLFAWQRFSEPYLWLRAGSLSVLILFVALIAFEEHTAFFALAAGLVLGTVLGLASVRSTTFMPSGGETLVQPDRVVGLLLSVLLIGRVCWRLAAGPADVGLGWNLASFVRNPSTMLLFGLCSAHFLAYALGIVLRVGARAAARVDAGPDSMNLPRLPMA